MNTVLDAAPRQTIKYVVAMMERLEYRYSYAIQVDRSNAFTAGPICLQTSMTYVVQGQQP